MNVTYKPESQGDDQHMQPHVPAEIAILPLFGLVVYPQTVTPLAVSQPASVQLIDESLRDSGVIGLITLRDERTRPEQITAEDCYTVGTAAVVHRLLRLPDGTLRVAVEGIERVVIEEIVATTPFMRARVRTLPEQQHDHVTAEQQIKAVLTQVGALAQLLPTLDEELQVELFGEESPLRLAYLIASSMLPHSSVTERQALLEQSDFGARLERLSSLLTRELTLAKRVRQAGEVAPPRRQEGLVHRQELLALPLAESLLALGRQEGYSAGQRAALETLLRARFEDTPDRDTLVDQLTHIDDSVMIQRLIERAAVARHVGEVATILQTIAQTSDA